MYGVQSVASCISPIHTIVNHIDNYSTSPTTDNGDEEDNKILYHFNLPLVNLTTIVSTLNNTNSAIIATTIVTTTSQFGYYPICKNLFLVHVITLHAEKCCDEGKDDTRTTPDMALWNPVKIIDNSTASSGGGGGVACLILHGLDNVFTCHIITKEDKVHPYYLPPMWLFLCMTSATNVSTVTMMNKSFGSNIPFSGRLVES